MAAILKKIYDGFVEATAGNNHFQILGKYYYRVKTGEKVAALTFDDGPLEPYTRDLLGVLKKHNAKATFFFVGEKIEAAFDLARRVCEEGHELGNHSYSHPHMIMKTPEFIRDEILKTDELLKKVGVREQIRFRSPYRQKLLALPYVLWKMKRENILYDFFPTPRDWKSADSEMIAADIVRRTRPGSILVLHDGNKNAAPYVCKTTDLVLRGLKARGYRLETVSELLKRVS